MILIYLLIILYKKSHGYKHLFASISPVFVFENAFVFNRDEVDLGRTNEKGYRYYKNIVNWYQDSFVGIHKNNYEYANKNIKL